MNKLRIIIHLCEARIDLKPIVGIVHISRNTGKKVFFTKCGAFAMSDQFQINLNYFFQYRLKNY